MANRTRAQLSTDSLGFFPDNTSQLITPADLRDWITNGIESFVTQKDTSRFQNAFYENKGSNITAGATTNLVLASGNFIHIQGTTEINNFGNLDAGARFILMFEDAANLRASANLIIPGIASGGLRVAVPGDCCLIVSEGGGAWRIVGYFPAGGAGSGTITGVTAGIGLSGGGTTGNVTVNLANTSVTPNSYTNADITVDAQGRITAASSGTSGGVTSVSVNAPLSDSGTPTAPNLSIPQANGSTDGFLDSADWTTFNGKQDALGFTPVPNTRSISTSSPLSGGGDLTADRTISIPKADASTDGYLDNADWTTFNGKQAAGNYITALTGDVTASGPGSVAATIANGAVDIPMLSATGIPSATTFLRGDNKWETPSGGGSGTVNSGTFNRLAYYSTNPTGTAVSELPTAGSSGQILQSNGTGSAPSWVNAPAATLTLGTSIVGGATAGRLLLTTTSGANQVLNQDSNLNYDTTNDRLGIGVASPAARLDLAAPTGANPSLILAPSSAATISGTTNGSIWCDSVASNTSLTMRKDSGYTKIVTIDRNPDLAVGSASGVVISDVNGSLTKSADLTALGIYAQTNSITAITTGSGSLIGTVTGSTTLPVNFFGVGKTIETKFSGLITMPNGSPVCTIDFRITDGTTTSTLGTLVYDGSNISGKVYMVSTQLTCRTTGAGATFGVSGQMIVNHAPRSQETVFITPASVAISGLLTTASALTLQVVVTWTGTAGGSIDTRTHFCNYIN